MLVKQWRKWISGLGLFAAIFLGHTAPSSAQTQTAFYVGPAFDIPYCQSIVGPTYPVCVGGNITGSVTTSGGTSSVASWSFDAGQAGSLDDSNGTASFSFYAPGGYISQAIFGASSSSGSANPYITMSSSTTLDSSGSQTAAGGPWYVGYGQGMGNWYNAKALCSPCHQPGGVSCGEPISVNTGNEYEQVVDYETAGQNKLSFVRYYNSMALQDTYADELGPKWRSNYDRYLFLVSSTEVQAERADGQIVSFTLVGSTWTPDTDVDIKLTKSGTTWTLTDHDDTVETYATSGTEGVLQTIKLRNNGYVQTLNYTAGVLTSVSDSYSRSLSFTYTGGLLTGVTTPDSLTLTYGYTTVSGSNLLTSVAYNTSPVTSQTYLYENTTYPFALTGITDENGNRYATWAYDGMGRAISSQHGTGTTISDYTQVSYDDSTGNRTVTGPLGIQETYKFTALQGVPKLTEIDRAANGTVTAATRLLGYDSNGYLNSSIDWDGNITTYTNNAHGDPTTIVDASGSSVARTTTIVYDTTWVHRPKTITTPGTTTTNTYEASTGNLLTHKLADTTITTIPYSTNGQTRTWTYTYTATGQLLTVKLPRTDVTAKTTFGYTGGTLTSITDALTHVTTVNTYTGGGLPLTVTDPNSVLTTLAYDSRLRLHTSALTTGSGTLTTTYDHDAAGNLTKVTLPDSSYLSYSYDNAHRLYTITNILGETINLTLDAMGNTTQTLWKNAAATTKRQHTATFDALGRLLTDVGGMSQTTTFGYDSQSNLTDITDPLTNPSSQAFDALNRLETFTDALTNDTGFTYDAHDRPLTVTDTNGNVTSYVYDGFGEAIQQASPDSGTTVYHYNADGDLTSKTDAAAVVTNNTFDALDRILTRKYPAHAAENVAFTYDQTAHGDGIGRLTSLTDATGSLSRNYEERGLITTDARTIGTTTYTTTYAYDGAARISSITYPNSLWVIGYTRDTAGQITAVTATQPGHSAVNLATSVTHMPFGPLSALTWGNGVTDARTYDLDYRMTNVTDTATSAILNLTYGYDADNNVHTITDAVTSGNSQTLTYDVLNRLHTAAGGYGSLTYTYDNNGNRQADGATTYSYTTGTDILSAIGATTVGSTATGNINAIGTNTMTYNKANQLATAVVSGTTSTYTYDAFSQRLEAKVGAGAVSVEQYDLAGNMLMEATTAAETDYAYLDGMPIAAIKPSTPTISYIHTERLGTPQLATNASKVNVWTANYQPFGATTPTGTITQNLRLPGQYADATAYNHNGFRDYNTAIGRYLEVDPIGLKGGTNPYAFVGSNPAKYTDRLGLCFEDACVGEAIIAEAAVQALSAGVADVAEMLEAAEAGESAQGATGLPVAALPLAPEAPTTAPESPAGGQCTSVNPRDVIAPEGNLIGSPGNGPDVRILPGGQAGAEALLEQLLPPGSTPYTGNYPGTGYNLPNGGFVGYRPISGSGPPTIDLSIEGMNPLKFKFIE
jgi:RHS repeat-associated protein